MKQPNNHLFELIGERLRSDWREIETAPLPLRITMLLEQLKQREASALPERPVPSPHREWRPLNPSTAGRRVVDQSGQPSVLLAEV